GSYAVKRISYQKRPNRIKCLGFVTVPRRLPRAARRLIRTQKLLGCQACHRSAHPTPGQGDRPKIMAATAIVVNALKEPVEYEAKCDQEWESYILGPGERNWHVWKYKGKKKHWGSQHAPLVQVRYNAAGGKQLEGKLKLVSTPR